MNKRILKQSQSTQRILLNSNQPANPPDREFKIKILKSLLQKNEKHGIRLFENKRESRPTISEVGNTGPNPLMFVDISSEPEKQLKQLAWLNQAIQSELTNNNQLWRQLEENRQYIDDKKQFIENQRLTILKNLRLAEQTDVIQKRAPDHDPKWKILETQLSEKHKLVKRLSDAKLENNEFMKSSDFTLCLELKIMNEEIQRDLIAKSQLEVTPLLKYRASKYSVSNSNNSMFKVSLKSTNSIFQPVSDQFSNVSNNSSTQRQLVMTDNKSVRNFPVYLSDSRPSSLSRNSRKFVVPEMHNRRDKRNFSKQQRVFLHKHLKIELFRVCNFYMEEQLTLLTDEILSFEVQKKPMDSQLNLQNEYIKTIRNKLKVFREYFDFFERKFKNQKWELYQTQMDLILRFYY